MALTDIARQLKDTFEGFAVAGLQKEVAEFRETYGDAESIRIGEMDYIVINDVYRSEKYADIPESTSPLFYNSIRTDYAIIDARTSSTLIDEVYSRITYMQRVCEQDKDATPPVEEIIRNLQGLIGAEVNAKTALVESGGEGGTMNGANIFQCHLIKDTGVSASPDVYSFMLKSGEIKEIPDALMRQIRRTGEVKILQEEERKELERNNAIIQEAVFDKYINSDIEIQNISVKSIFEIRMNFCNIHLILGERGAAGRQGVFNTAYLSSKNNEFGALNANIHVCNSCGRDLVDVRDTSKVNRLHLNTDAFDPGLTKGDSFYYAVGCEDCLEQCPVCGSWHYRYEKFLGTRVYDRVSLIRGRGFLRGIVYIPEGANYCSCREGIEWVYDERSGSEEEHDIIPVEKMAFVNYADEKIASYADYSAYYQREKKRERVADGAAESAFAKRTLGKFKKALADRFETDVKDIVVTSEEKCRRCTVCGGEYLWDGRGDDQNFRCGVCEEMIKDRRRMVTRSDGVVFLRRTSGKKETVTKYLVTGLGNLKKLNAGTPDEEAGKKSAKTKANKR